MTEVGLRLAWAWLSPAAAPGHPNSGSTLTRRLPPAKEDQESGDEWFPDLPPQEQRTQDTLK